MEESRLLREHLLECEKLNQRLSSAVSDRKIPADLAVLVDALRCSVLAAMRIAAMLDRELEAVERVG